MFLEAGTRGALLKKVFLEISQNSQENTCARVSFLIKLQVDIFKNSPEEVVFLEILKIAKIPRMFKTGKTRLLRNYGPI